MTRPSDPSDHSGSADPFAVAFEPDATPVEPPADASALRDWMRGTAPEGRLDAKERLMIAEAVPAAFFGYPDGLTLSERQGLTYRRMQAAGLAAPPALDLLDDPPLLCGLLERCAVADPALFHVLMLHYTLALGPIAKFTPRDGTGPRPDRDALESMDAAGTLLMTEIGRSNSHLSPRTLARHDPETGGFVLTTPDAAAAKFPTNTAHPGVPKVAAVYATLVHGGRERGVFVFTVPLRAADGSTPPGVRITPAPDTFGLMVDYGAVTLTEVAVPFEAWLSDGARLEPDGGFHDPAGGPGERLVRSMGIAPPVWRAVVSACAALARASAVTLVAHTAGRATLGRLAPRRPLGDYRNQREAMLGALASAYALTLVADRVKGPRPLGRAPAAPPSSAGTGGAAWAPWSAVDRDLALLKAAVTEQAQDVVGACRVRAGAPGFAASNRLNGYRGLTHAYQNAGGDNELILFDTARALAADPPPAPDPVPEEAGEFGSPAMCRNLAASLEHLLTSRLSTQTAADAGNADAVFTAWNDNLTLAAATSRIAADGIVLRIVAEASRDVPDEAAPLLQPLLRLYGLDWIERRAALLMEHGVAGPGLLERVWAGRREVGDRLAGRVGDLAAALDTPTPIAAPATPREPTSST
ncbi:acyl-CoA dehydrogenase [Spirillospora sp. NPDC052269]